MAGVIFDLDQTIVDSSIAEHLRRQGNWGSVYPLIPKFALYPGIHEAFAYLRQKQIPVAIVTSSPSIYCGKVTSHFNVSCDNRVCYHDTKLRKPHPAPFHLALQKMGIDTKNVISFGDSPHDISASHAADIASVACLWGTDDRDAIIKASPHYIIERSEDLPEFMTKFF
ncbi:HAD family hydrolase [Chitinophaga sp. S165]|uniref:HAD family hydrolase n=1 Tax=Chitinophaga sp. S165 TaxID=2135462 RepID=UPI000D71B222|nr:HAD family hydrolase [Chitinophaga sp. S165]PWV55527.1 pyrophosphatase PpaX [Chitinophaga sp. S165]